MHFDDVRVLLKVFQRLVDAGHSVLVIEHNLEVIKSADWIIDLGPEAGDEGGRIVAAGTPEEIAACAAKSYLQGTKTFAGQTGLIGLPIQTGVPGPEEAVQGGISVSCRSADIPVRPAARCPRSGQECPRSIATFARN